MNIHRSEVMKFINPGHVDMRKQINCLPVICEEEFANTPFSGNLFLFCNKTR